MKTVGNILWFVLAGFWLALGYAITGVIFCVTLIGIPFGLQLFKMAGLALWPFGRTAAMKPGQPAGWSVVANVIWLVLFGWGMFLAHLVSGALLCITIIGIPFGIQAFKLSLLALWPFGREIVRT